VPTKVLELCSSKIQFTEAHYAESKEVQHRSGHYTVVAQLARLTAKILRLHLASHHLLTTGMKATMAQRLHDTIHAPDASVQQYSVDFSVSQLQQDATLMLRQQSDDPALSHQQGTRQQGTQQQQQGTQ